MTYKNARKSKRTVQYAAIDPRFPIDSLAQVWQDDRDNALRDAHTMAKIQKRNITIGIRSRVTEVYLTNQEALAVIQESE